MQYMKEMKRAHISMNLTGDDQCVTLFPIPSGDILTSNANFLLKANTITGLSF